MATRDASALFECASCRAIHVEAHDGNGQVRCGDYRLALDEAGCRAFVLGKCDPVTQTTELRLIDRHLLFTRVENIAQPILPTLTASRPPAPPPPFVSETCWAVIGPTVIGSRASDRLRSRLARPCSEERRH